VGQTRGRSHPPPNSRWHYFPSADNTRLRNAPWLRTTGNPEHLSAPAPRRCQQPRQKSGLHQGPDRAQILGQRAVGRAYWARRSRHVRCAALILASIGKLWRAGGIRWRSERAKIGRACAGARHIKVLGWAQNRACFGDCWRIVGGSGALPVARLASGMLTGRERQRSSHLLRIRCC